MREKSAKPVLPYESVHSASDLNASARKKARKNMRRMEELGSVPSTREAETVEGLARFSELVRGYLQQEIEDLGLNARVDIDSRRIHVVDRKRSDFPYKGLYSTYTKASYANRRFIFSESKNEEEAKFKLFWTVLHELIHSIQMRSMILVNPANEDPAYRRSRLKESQVLVRGFKGEISADGRRTGYHSWYNRFQVFNEMVNEKIGVNVLKRHWDELRREFDFFPKDLPAQPEIDKNLDTMNLIASRLSQKSGVSEQVIWRKWLRGQFTGEMMHLRELETHFGPGTLEVLANWENWRKPYGREGLTRSTRNPQLFREYFMTDDQTRRDSIAKQILPEFHWKRYSKMAKIKIHQF